MIQIKQLEWNQIETHFGRSWLAIVSGLNTKYAVWTDRSTGRTIASDPNGIRYEYNSIDDAKAWCQSDFETKIWGLLKCDFEMQITLSPPDPPT
jgi:hypothetical protein